MLDHATNELLTRVGPGTPCGEFLHRYWHPVGYSSELAEAGQTKRVRILGEVYGSAPDVTDLREWMGGYLPMSCAPDPTFRQRREFGDIFDDSHVEYEIPADSPVMRG
jgi:hypothetical protein